MANEEKKIPQFKNQKTQLKRRLSATDVKIELRKEFRERLKISRNNSQDSARGNLLEIYNKTIQESSEEIRKKILAGSTKYDEMDFRIKLLEEVTKELADMDEERLIEFYEQEYNFDRFVESMNILCKLCGEFLEQNLGTQEKYLCDNCTRLFVSDVPN